MRAFRWAGPALGLMAFGLMAFGLIAVTAAEAGELKNRSVILTYNAMITEIPAGAKAVDLWMPVAQDADGQVVTKVEVVSPGGGAIATEGTYGNKIFYKRFEPPFPEELGAEIRFEIHRTEIMVPAAKDLAPMTAADLESRFSAYLESDALIPVEAAPVKDLVSRLDLRGKSPIHAARAIYDYLIDEFTYNWQAEGAGRGDVLWACDSKTGDCSDYHSLFLALCRNRGIPADHEFGFALRSKNPEGEIASYHCWARFYVKGVGWIPIDASEADKHPELREYNFGSLTQDLLKFTHGRDVVLEPPQQGAPLNKFIHPYVEIDGAPHEAVKMRVSYQEIPPLSR